MGNLGFEATEESVRAMIEAHERSREAKSKGKQKKESDDDDDKSDAEEESTPTGPPSLKKVRMGTFEDSGLCKG